MADKETVKDKDSLQPLAKGHEHTSEITLSRSNISLNSSEIENFQQLGLGRGVDATSLTPWQNITSQQMREVTPHNVVVTRENAKNEYYRDEICSEKKHHEKVMASVEDPNGTVQLGVFAENFRSKSRDAIVEGYKAQTRSVVFRDEVIDVWTPPDEASMSLTARVPLAIIDESLASTEENVCRVILSYIEYRQKHDMKASKPRKDKPIKDLVGDDPATKLGDYLQSLDKDSKGTEEIMKACSVFVNQIQVTHYVHALELGAYKCQVSNKVERGKEVSIGAQSMFKQVLGMHCFGGASDTALQHETSSVTIGKMEEDKGRVTRVIEEGVITVQLKPLHTLIERHLWIRQAMESAVKEYIKQRKQEDSENKKQGPFRISCRSGKVYWKVNEESRLVGTANRDDSTPFFFVENKDSDVCDGKNMFWIATTDSKRVKVTRKNCPLKVQDIVVKMKHKHLTLHRCDGQTPVNVHNFTTGGLYYFKRAEGKRYIAMETSHTSSAQYIATCVRTSPLTSLESHEKPPRKWILFKLHPEDAELTEVTMDRADMKQLKRRNRNATDGDCSGENTSECEDEHLQHVSEDACSLGSECSDDTSESEQEYLQSVQSLDFSQLFQQK